MPERLTPPSQIIVNVVENLACLLAEKYGGSITVNHLMPYLPLSLGFIRRCLDHMVDGHTVYATTRDDCTVYEFAAYHEVPSDAGILHVGACVSCGRTFPPKRRRVQCADCRRSLHKELQRLAGSTNWVAEAVAEHNILFIAAQYPEPLPTATLASRSHLTLREMKQTLSRMGLDGYLQQDVHGQIGVMTYRFPPVTYPRSHYRDNLAVVQSCLSQTGRRVEVKTLWGGAGLGVVVLAGLLYYFLPTSLPSSQQYQHPVPVSTAPKPAARPASPQSGTMPSPPYGQAYHDLALKDAEPVHVSIRDGGFSPVEMRVAARWNATTPLTPDRPEEITREPAYRGSRQMYGVLRLGTMANNTSPFVIDLISGPHPVLYFDTNRNGDLTDDGGPLSNQGSGIFATTIRIPFATLFDQVQFPQHFILWLFTNDRLWSQGAVAHYSRTQLQGTVRINGVSYVAYLADSDGNDADFTNDGISVDLDGDGKIDRDTERFLPHQVARIGDKHYAFQITW